MKIINLNFFTMTLLLIVLYPFPATVAAAKLDDYNFRVLLDNKPIGTYQVNLIEKGEVSQVEILVSLDVKLLFLSVYRYEHQNTETWSDGCLQTIVSRTDDNGELYELEGTKRSDNLQLRIGKDEAVLPGCVRSFAYWQPELLKDERLLNSQTGEYQIVSVTEMGNERVEIGSTLVDSRRLQLTTDKDVIDLWYSKDGRWVALQSRTRSGQTLRYEIIEEQTDA